MGLRMGGGWICDAKGSFPPEDFDRDFEVDFRGLGVRGCIMEFRHSSSGGA